MSKKVTTSTFRKMKRDKQKISMITAYDYPTAKIFDECGVDSILVGDSLGMVVLGYEDTTKVTMDDMIHHTRAVTRGVKNALVVTDMPFLSYHTGISDAVKNAGRIIQEGCAGAVKLEGGREVTDEIRAIIKAGIPVIGHIGLTPQAIHNIGGYMIQVKTIEQARKLIDDAKALEDAGVFSLVMECVPAELAEMITTQVSIPTIGIGAGKGCDGQVLVSHDVLGMFQGKAPSFVKQYENVGKIIAAAVSKYVEEVKNSAFPSDEQSFHLDSGVIDNLYGGAK